MIARVERVEAALAMKFDLLAKRVDKMNLRFESLEKRDAEILQIAKQKKTATRKTTSKTRASAVKKRTPVTKKLKTVAKKLKPVAKKVKPVAKKHTPMTQKVAGVAAKHRKAQEKAPVIHQIQKGETLYNISKRYKTTVDQLRRLNKLSKTAKIFPGDNLIVQ